MYISMVVGLMLILPMASIALDVFTQSPKVLSAAVLARWFVFWVVGVRLLVAGLRQIAQPRYTAETLLGVKDPDAILIVRELGFANTAIGSVGLCSVFLPAWNLPLAAIGAIFYGLAGINHAARMQKNKLEIVAMISDLYAAAMLLAVCIATNRAALL